MNKSHKWWDVYQHLDRMFTTQEAIEWLETPNVVLGDRKPKDCTADECLSALKSLREELNQ